MNRYYYQPQQPHYYAATPVPSPWGLYDDRYYYQTPPVSMMPVFYPQSVHYVDEVAILDTMSYPQSMHYVDEVAILDTMSYPDQFMQYVEEVAILEEATHSYMGQNNNAGRSGGSGLSMEEISRRLRVCAAAAERETSAEVETCSICLDDCVKKQKTARLECGHVFHVDCITHWLISKNVCPLCRATALH